MRIVLAAHAHARANKNTTFQFNFGSSLKIQSTSDRNGLFYYREAKSQNMNDFSARKELCDALEDFMVVGTTKDDVPSFLESAPGNPLNVALGNVKL